MWNLVNKINKQNRNRLLGTENRLAAVEGREFGRLGEGIKQIKNPS